MLPDYADIHAAAGHVRPDWYDENGVPRFAVFAPDMLGVYDSYALLVTVACQSCAARFPVGLGWPSWGTALNPDTRTFEVRRYALVELAQGFKYGDPPRHACGGDSMTSVAVRIEEAWERGPGKPWVRRPDVEEIDVLPEWVREDGDEARFVW